MTKPNSWITAAPVSSMLCRSQISGSISCSSKWSELSSNHLCLHCTQPLHLKWWGKDVREKQHKEKTASIHTLIFKSSKLFATGSHCHCSGKSTHLWFTIYISWQQLLQCHKTETKKLYFRSVHCRDTKFGPRSKFLPAKLWLQDHWLV